MAYQDHGSRENFGFTLVEMLIVIAISAMLATIVVGYSSVGRNEVALSVESVKVSQIILQAKSLALATYGSATHACGYGVSFNVAAQTYSIFGYHPSSSALCPPAGEITSLSPSEMSSPSPATWNIHLENGVVMYATSTDSLSDVLFYPPDPATLISINGSSFSGSAQAAHVYLKTAGNTATTTISVSPGGQVEF